MSLAGDPGLARGWPRRNEDRKASRGTTVGVLGNGSSPRGRIADRSRAISAVVFLASILIPSSFAGADFSQVEREVKAAFLYQFTRFAEWPDRAFEDTGNRLVVGVLGQDPFGDTLDRAMAGKTVAGRPLAVRRFRTVEELGPCHVLFVNLPRGKQLRAALARVATEPVLTVGDDEAFLDEGGVVRFRIEERHVRFEVNLEAARRAGIGLSSRLLQVASRVRRDEAARP